MKKQSIETLTNPQHKAVAAVRHTGQTVVANPPVKAPLDKKGKPMTRMCPWCSYPMKPFLNGWLLCDHCNATEPVTPDSDKFLSTKVRPPISRNSAAYKGYWRAKH